jgi:DNA-binding MarR family transcriptional regulator
MAEKKKQSKRKLVITKQEQVLMANSITGDLERANVKVSVHIQRDQAKYKGEPFTILFQKLGVITAKSIRPVTAKVLLYLCAAVEYGNVINKGSQQIAEELGFSQRNVLRALKELEDAKIIIREQNPTDKRLTSIYLNPYHSWKGNIDDRKLKIAKHDPDQLDMFPEYEGTLPNKKLKPNPNIK